MKSVVVDTNVFVSALTSGRTCKQILNLFRNAVFNLVISEDILSEISSVLSRPKFEFDKNNLENILRYIYRKAQKVAPLEKVLLCRDSKDNIVLECATIVKVDFIVTGDKDLLSLKSFRNIPIITPKKFLQLLNK